MTMHISDKVCSCEYCTKIDIMYGDPLLTLWEKDFLESVADQGWQRDYSDKQKAVIDKVFKRLHSIRTAANEVKETTMKKIKKLEKKKRDKDKGD